MHTYLLDLEQSFQTSIYSTIVSIDAKWKTLCKILLLKSTSSNLFLISRDKGKTMRVSNLFIQIKRNKLPAVYSRGELPSDRV